MLIDAHNHLQSPLLGAAAGLVKAMGEIGIRAAIVNGTHPGDWPLVERLAANFPGQIIPAYGLHPWYVDQARPGWEGDLARYLTRDPRASVGEIGLDGWVDSPPPARQMPAFLTQLRIARELDRPVTIHCLKAWQALFDALNHEPPPPRILMHSFGGSIEIAQRLIPLGASFSFSGYFLHARKAKQVDVFRKIPRERLMIETDSPDMAPPADHQSHALPDGVNHPANLGKILAELAIRFDEDPDQLAHTTAENAVDFFGIIPPPAS